MLNKKTIFFSVFILLYVILSQFVFKLNITSIENILIWLLIALVIKHNFITGSVKAETRKSILQYVVIIGILYILIYAFSGIFLDFANNPYDTSIIGIIYNFSINGIIFFIREYTRYKIISNENNKKNSLIVSIILVVAFTLMELNITNIIANMGNVYFVFKTIFYNIFPTLMKNIVFTYIVTFTDYIPNIVYEFIINAVFWLSPILPNATKIVQAVSNIVFPITLLGCVRYNYLSNSKIKTERKSIKHFSISRYIISSIVFIMIMWFGLGVFPYKPIAIATASMVPVFYPGDVAIVKKTDPLDIEVGDIIRYSLDNYTVVHRVIAIDKDDDGNPIFTTKGDSNGDADNEPVLAYQVMGVSKYKIKYLGLPAIWLHSLNRNDDVKVETGDSNI